MRLLNVEKFLNGENLPFKVFRGGSPPDGYAILSHTWFEEANELRHQDIENGTRKGTRGYRKIKACCRKAKQHGYGYVWADTCCIDKTNPVELQEAINSMFKWYKEAKICYAYLADYDAPAELQFNNEEEEDGGEGGAIKEEAFEEEAFEEEVFEEGAFKEEKLKKSKWFTRGWTLQELIAPKEVVFYTHDWKYIGSKVETCNWLRDITRISPEVLAGEEDSLKKSSVAQRMSWASGRETARVEDIAYCLLGIFDVHMPSLYGEGGDRAFLRLQKEIMKQSDDHSLFAWKEDGGYTGYGLLASSPMAFAESSTLIRVPYFEPRSAYMMTNRGLEIRLSLTCTLNGEDHFVTLGCADERNGKKYQIGFYVAPMDDNRFVRTRLDQLVRIQSLRSDHKQPTLETIYFPEIYLSEIPARRQCNFRVIKPQLPDWKDKLRGMFIPRIRTRKGSFISLTKAASVGFPIAGFTFPGWKMITATNILEFGLERGGRVGVLFKPSKQRFPNESIELKYIAMIFGVNFDGSVYGDITGITKQNVEKTAKEMMKEPNISVTENTSQRSSITRLRTLLGRYIPIYRENSPTLVEKEIWDMMRTRSWVEKYIQDYSVNSSTQKVDKEIWDMIFSVEVQGKTVQGHMVYFVEMSYRSK